MTKYPFQNTLEKFSKGTSSDEIQDIVQNFRHIHGEYSWRWVSHARFNTVVPFEIAVL